MPLRVNETAKWGNSFIIVVKSNGTVWFYQDLASVNKTLIQLIHRGPTLNNILDKLTNACYVSITDASFRVSQLNT